MKLALLPESKNSILISAGKVDRVFSVFSNHAASKERQNTPFSFSWILFSALPPRLCVSAPNSQAALRGRWRLKLSDLSGEPRPHLLLERLIDRLNELQGVTFRAGFRSRAADRCDHANQGFIAAVVA